MRAEFRQDLYIFVVMALAMIIGVSVSGCAQKPLKAPQSSAVEGGFRNIESGVSTAQAQNTDITTESAKARTKLENIRDKEILQTRYREYRAKHPRPTPVPSP